MRPPEVLYHRDRAEAARQVALLEAAGATGIVGTRYRVLATVLGYDVWLVVTPGRPTTLALSAEDARAALAAGVAACGG